VQVTAAAGSTRFSGIILNQITKLPNITHMSHLKYLQFNLMYDFKSIHNNNFSQFSAGKGEERKRCPEESY
jgi:hypothetical protein